MRRVLVSSTRLSYFTAGSTVSQVLGRMTRPSYEAIGSKCSTGVAPGLHKAAKSSGFDERGLLSR